LNQSLETLEQELKNLHDLIEQVTKALLNIKIMIK
jgi:hypothetical protein